MTDEVYRRLRGLIPGLVCLLTVACGEREPTLEPIRLDLPPEWTTRPSPAWLLILISPDDCALCLFEAEFWQEVHDQSPAIRVIGITDGGPDFRDAFIADTGIRFPLHHHPALFGTILERTAALNPDGTTPFKILIDEHGAFIYTETGSKDIERQKTLRQRLEKALHSGLSD